MRIIYISDIHGKFDALDALPHGDLLLVGGDFTQFGTLDDFKEATLRVKARFPLFMAVAGNLDVPEADDFLAGEGLLLSPSHVWEKDGLKFAGIGGANKSPFNTPYEWDDADMAGRLAHFLPGQIDVLVSHAPPFDCGADMIGSGIGVGSKAVRDLAERVQPSIVLCGHIHEARGIYSMGAFPVVNPGPFGDMGNYAEILVEPGHGASAWLSSALGA